MNEIVKNMPKVVIHIHLDGSLRPESVQRWLRKQEIIQSIEEITENLKVNKDCRNLNEYLQKFDLPKQVLQNEDNIKEATYELFEDLSKQNVIYAEVRFAPSKHIEQGLTYKQVVEAAIKGMNEAKSKFGIDGALILCCMRGESEERNIETVKVAKRFLDSGVVGIDLAGAEAMFPTSAYERIFYEARNIDIPFTIHAGEADGPESIRTALKFGAKRIGHGVRSIEDDELIEELKTKEIPLEICPTSNLQTQAIEGKHPLEELYRRGLFVTISTDNDTVSNTNILEEYDWVLKNTSLTYKDLLQMNINAAKAIFAPSTKKEELIARIESFEAK